MDYPSPRNPVGAGPGLLSCAETWPASGEACSRPTPQARGRSRSAGRSSGCDLVSECGELFTRLQAQGGLFAQSSYLSRAGSKPQGPQEGWRGLPARAQLGRCGEPLWPKSALRFPKQASDWRPSLSACFCQQPLESEIPWGS